MLYELFEQLRNTASANERKELMRTALEGEQRDLIISIFQDCYGPNKYNVTSDRILNELQAPSIMFMSQVKAAGDHLGILGLTIDEDYELFHNMLNNLTNRTVTGYAAIEYAASVLVRYQQKDLKILRDILDKNLKVGFSLEQINKLLGKKKKEFECSLAYNLDKVTGVNPIDGTYYASRKLDGARCICFVHSELQDEKTIVSEPIFKSRQNKEFTTLNNLKEPVKRLIEGYHLIGDIVLDGEVCIMDDNGDEHFDWIMKEIRRKDHTIENPCYNIFDVLTLEEFNGEKESEIFSTRNFYLLNAFHHLHTKYGKQKELKLLKQELITSQEDFDRWSGYVTKGNWEGFMLRKDVPYKSGRTKDLLKVKKFKDAEYVVEGIDLGTAKYNTEVLNVVRSIQITHKGNRVDVGSGLSKEQRVEWFKDPSKIIGKTVTIQYFEETQDQLGNYSLRFPVLKYVYENGRDC